MTPPPRARASASVLRARACAARSLPPFPRWRAPAYQPVRQLLPCCPPCPLRLPLPSVFSVACRRLLAVPAPHRTPRGSRVHSACSASVPSAPPLFHSGTASSLHICRCRPVLLSHSLSISLSSSVVFGARSSRLGVGVRIPSTLTPHLCPPSPSSCLCPPFRTASLVQVLLLRPLSFCPTTTHTFTHRGRRAIHPLSRPAGGRPYGGPFARPLLPP